MRSPCPRCGHALWSEVRRHGAYRFVVYFDDERSDTHSERIRSCPGCGELLAGHAPDPQGLASRPRVRRVVPSRDPRSH